MDDKSQAFAALELTDVERELMRQFNRLDASGRELMLNEARHYALPATGNDPSRHGRDFAHHGPSGGYGQRGRKMTPGPG